MDTKQLSLIILILVCIVPSVSALNEQFNLTIPTNPTWFIVSYDTPEILSSYSLNSSVSYSNAMWRIYGTNDNLSFLVLDNQSGIGFVSNIVQTFPITCTPVGYKFYYIDIESGFTNPSANLTLIMNPITLPPPVAHFSANQTVGYRPMTVQFTSTSENATSYYWTFGDGNTSTLQNPKFTYNMVGVYTVSLNVTNNNGYNKSTKINYITVVANIPHASFTSNVTEAYSVPLVVQFNDTSTTSPTAWYWEFGDGNTSILQNPINTYFAYGQYTVGLTTTNAEGSNQTIITNYIKIFSTNTSVINVSPRNANYEMVRSIKLRQQSDIEMYIIFFLMASPYIILFYRRRKKREVRK